MASLFKAPSLPKKRKLRNSQSGRPHFTVRYLFGIEDVRDEESVKASVPDAPIVGTHPDPSPGPTSASLRYSLRSTTSSPPSKSFGGEEECPIVSTKKWKIDSKDELGHFESGNVVKGTRDEVSATKDALTKVETEIAQHKVKVEEVVIAQEKYVSFIQKTVLEDVDPNKLSAYRDRRFPGSQEEFEHALQTSTTVYIGNMSFYTTEEQIYELFSRAGEIKKIIMGLDKNSKTPCGFCFILYYSRDDAEDAVKYISGTILDDRPIRVDFDWGFQEGRQWGRGRSGGQVRDEYRTDYDPGRGGYGKLVQRELEAQRQLVDYGTGSLGSFHPVMPSHYGGRHGGDHGHGGSRHGRDYNHRKRYREDDRRPPGKSKRFADHESRRASDHESRPEKNPRFRESGDSDEEEDDDRKRRH